MKDFDNKHFEHFKKVEGKRFLWQTENTFISDKEKELLSILNSDQKDKILEVGCGEGANIFNMHFQGSVIGIDYSFNRLKFAKNKINNYASFICGNAMQLPFLDDKFDLVFSRDLLHHLINKNKAITEMIRVCRRKGTLAIIEMNGSSNFIGRIFASLIEEERGMKNININQLISNLTSSGAINIKVIMMQPLLLYRVIFHYKLYFSWLAKSKLLKRLFSLIEQIGKDIIPKERWGYFVILAEKSA